MTYPQQPYTQPAPPPAPAPRKTPTALKVIGLAVGGMVIFGIGAAAGSSSGDTASGKPAPRVTVTTTAKADSGAKADSDKEKPAEEKKPSGSATTFGSGSYLVGDEVAAGTYKTSGPSDTDLPNCYWARNKDASGDMDSIIANGNPEGPTRLTVQEGEIVETSGCGTWTKVG